PLQGYCELVVQPAFRPGGRCRETGSDSLGAEGQADLVHGAWMPGSGQGTEPTERVSGPEVGGKLDALFLDRRALRSGAKPYPSSPSGAQGPVLRRFRRGGKPAFAGLWRLHGGLPADLSLGLGYTTFSGLSATDRSVVGW